MLISNLELLDYRNYPKLSAIFTSGLNVIIGDNGVGKTNIVEAIDLFGFAKSFRTNETKNLIRQGTKKAIIVATIHTPSRTEIQIELQERSKRVLVNGKVIPKLSHLSRYVSCTTFQPEDVLFFDDAPAKRRRFIDTNIVRQDEVYLAALSRYEKLLKERNALLKQENSEELLKLIDTPFLEEAAIVVAKRMTYIKDLADSVNKILKELTNEFLNLKLQYSSSFGSKETILKSGRKVLESVRQREKALESTTLGPHRDDLIAILNGRNVKEHASQGQKRLIAIALTLAPYFMEKEDHKKPIIILDDVLSELDENHQERLINLLLKCKQSFITATRYDNHAHAIYEVTDTKEIRRIN
ncbi:MAG: DNA replication and repair protein RecF [Bacilli bacterium]